MDLGITDKVALATASSKGLGLASALALAAEGARVCIASRDEGNLKAAAGRIVEQTGAEVIYKTCDMRDRASLAELCDFVRRDFGEPDILVNNTGGPNPGGFFDLEIDDWLEGYRLLVESTVVLYAELIPAMRRRRWGRIVNITSTTSRQPVPNLILSNAFRPGLLGLAKSVADDVGRDGVLINTVLPGLTLTDRVRQLADAGGGDNIIERLSKQVSTGRAAEPEELGAVVAFLCSQKASNLTGGAVACDGGLIRGL